MLSHVTFTYARVCKSHVTEHFCFEFTINYISDRLMLCFGVCVLPSLRPVRCGSIVHGLTLNGRLATHRQLSRCGCNRFFPLLLWLRWIVRPLVAVPAKSGLGSSSCVWSLSQVLSLGNSHLSLIAVVLLLGDSCVYFLHGLAMCTVCDCQRGYD